MATIYLIRHGQASFGAEDYDKLSELGQRQAGVVGEYLRDHGIELDAAYSGDLLRQRETAQLALASQPGDVPHTIDPRFNELDNDEQIRHLMPEVVTRRPEIKALVDKGLSDSKDYQKVIDAVFNFWVSPECDEPAIQSWAGFSAAYGYGDAVNRTMREAIERDFHYQPRPDAIGYDDGAVWELGGGISVRAIHGPGHTAGHCVLLVEPEGVAFIGDIDLSGFGPYYGDHTSDLAAFRRTLAALPAIPARTWVTSHHRGVYSDREHFLVDLEAFRSKIDQREARLLELLRERPRSLGELVSTGLLYPPDADIPWARAAEQRTIDQHLRELAADGRVVRYEGDRFRVAP